ncbi:hypothetical protein EDB19DRAFT_1828163 [Suillus lakei]|nr:hypothetical protein EDB19DRAFT_1828163 [Suillus lakei]
MRFRSARWLQKCLLAELQGRFLGVKFKSSDATVTPTIAAAEIIALCKGQPNNLHEPCIIGRSVMNRYRLMFRDVIVLNVLEGIESAVTSMFARLSHSRNPPSPRVLLVWFSELPSMMIYSSNFHIWNDLAKPLADHMHLKTQYASELREYGQTCPCDLTTYWSIIVARAVVALVYVCARPTPHFRDNFQIEPRALAEVYLPVNHHLLVVENGGSRILSQRSWPHFRAVRYTPRPIATTCCLPSLIIHSHNSLHALAAHRTRQGPGA